MALQICCSVNPVNAAPETVNEALSPGSKPSFTEPPLKSPDGPVRNAKSNTVELKPCDTFPTSASEKVKFADRLGACMPVKPFSPEVLALPAGGKSKPIPVIVDVDPGVVMAEVFVMVKVKVFVWELNSHTTVAVENWPESTPVTVIVSALTVALAANTSSAARGKNSLPNRDIGRSSLLLCLKPTLAWARPHFGPNK